MRYLLVYDMISSGTKASVFSTDGTLIASAYRVLPISIENRYVQQDPEDWWHTVVETTHEILPAFQAEQVAAICFTAQSQVCLCVDKEGNALMPAITWADTRSLEVEDNIGNGISQAEHFQLTGLTNTPNSSIRKLMWVQQKRPDIYKKTYKMIQCKDYLVMRFTGRVLTDYSDASSTFALDIEKNCWAERIIELSGVDAEKLPELVNSNEVVGSVTASVAMELGLKVGTPVVIGAGDILCSAVGAGCVHDGDLYMSLGSSSWIARCSQIPIEDPLLTRPTINPHAIPGMFLNFVNYQNAGVVFKWLKNSILQYDPLGTREVQPFQNVYPYTEMEPAVRKSPIGANGLLCLPHLLNPTSNHPQPYTAGAYIGLKWTHTRDDLMRAALEGITFEVRRFVDFLREERTCTMTIVGIASHETYWLQMMADIFNLTIYNTELSDTPDSIGAAIIAGQAVGIYDSFDIAARFCNKQDLFTPDPVRVRTYERLYQIYLTAFDGIEGTLQALSAFEDCDDNAD